MCSYLKCVYFSWKSLSIGKLRNALISCYWKTRTFNGCTSLVTRHKRLPNPLWFDPNPYPPYFSYPHDIVGFKLFSKLSRIFSQLKADLKKCLHFQVNVKIRRFLKFKLQISSELYSEITINFSSYFCPPKIFDQNFQYQTRFSFLES